MELSEKLSASIKNTPFRCRPLAFILAVFLCALFLYHIELRVFFIFLAICIGFCVNELFFSKLFKRGKGLMAYFVLFAIVSAVLVSVPAQLTYAKVARLEGERTVKAVIKDSYYVQVYESMYLADIETIDGKKCDCKAAITFYGNPGVDEYDTVYVKANVVYDLKNKSGADRLSAIGGGAIITCEVLEIEKVSDEARNGFLYAVDSARRAIGARFSSLLSPKTSAYAQAMFIGDKDGMPRAFKTDMSALGISHMLAVSGMHMSIIAAIIMFIVERISYSRRLKSAFVIAGSLAFMAIAGFSPSVVRSALMLIIAMLSVFFYGRSDSITSLFTAGAIICVLEPNTILNCSFLLSFSATLGIVLCALYAEGRARYALYSSRWGDMRLPFKAVRSVAFSVLMTVCATLFTVPVMSLYFSQTSFAAVVTNLVAVPMSFVSVMLCVVVLVFGGIPYLGGAVCSLFDLIYVMFENFVTVFADTFRATVSLRYPFFKICLILLVAILVFMWLHRVQTPLAVISAFVCVSVVYASLIQIYGIIVKERTDVVYYAGKSSEGFLIADGNDSYIVDIGNGAKGVPLLCAEDAFEEYYGTRLDGYVITHYHSFHIGTVKSLLRYVGVETLYLPEPKTSKEKSFYESIVLACKDEGGTEIVMYKREEQLRLGEVLIQSIPYSLIERSAHPVLALRISKGSRAIGYIGASVSESSKMANADMLISECETIIVGAQGPTNKSDAEFLYFVPSSKVYLSPYEVMNEKIAFPGATYARLKAIDGMARKTFRLT